MQIRRGESLRKNNNSDINLKSWHELVCGAHSKPANKMKMAVTHFVWCIKCCRFVEGCANVCDMAVGICQRITDDHLIQRLACQLIVWWGYKVWMDQTLCRFIYPTKLKARNWKSCYHTVCMKILFQFFVWVFFSISIFVYFLIFQHSRKQEHEKQHEKHKLYW